MVNDPSSTPRESKDTVNAPDGPAPTQTLVYFAAGLRRMGHREVAVVACRLLAIWIAYQGVLFIGYFVPAAIVYAMSPASIRDGQFAGLAAMGVPFLAVCGFAGLLWWKAHWFATRILPATPGLSGEPDQADESKGEAQEDEVEQPDGNEADPSDAENAGEDDCVTQRPGPRSIETAEPPAVPTPASRELTVLNIAFMTVGVFVLADAIPALARVLLPAIFTGSQPFSAWWNDNTWQGQLWTAVLKTVLGAWLLLGARGIVTWARRVRRDAAPGSEEEPGGRPL